MSTVINEYVEQLSSGTLNGNDLANLVNNGKITKQGIILLSLSINQYYYY